MKVNVPTGLGTLIDFATTVDSDGFCTTFFEVYQSQAEEKTSISKNSANRLHTIRKEAYQKYLDTVIAACTAASVGDVNKLKALYYIGVDLGQGDYDKRTPLHIAVSKGMYDAVVLLVKIGVNISAVDRWGSTPLNDAVNSPRIYQYLVTNKAKLGKLTQVIAIVNADDVADD